MAQAARQTDVPPKSVDWKPSADWRWDRNTTHNARHLLPILLFVRFVPKAVNRLLARLVATLLAHTMRKTRRVVRHNVEMVSRGTLDRGAVARAVTRTFRNYALYIVDFMDLLLYDRETIGRSIRHRDGTAVFDELLASGKGAILVTPHLGHWELGGILLAQDGFPVKVAGPPVPDPWTEAFHTRIRNRMGVGRVLLGDGPTGAFSPIPLVHALRQNQFIALLTDRDSASRACPVDFFDGRMAMPTGAAVLAYVTGAPILPVYVVRQGTGYEAAHEPPIDPARYRDMARDDAVTAMTREMARAFERIIGCHVEEWYNFFPEWMEDPS